MQLLRFRMIVHMVTCDFSRCWLEEISYSQGRKERNFCMDARCRREWTAYCHLRILCLEAINTKQKENEIPFIYSQRKRKWLDANEHSSVKTHKKTVLQSWFHLISYQQQLLAFISVTSLLCIICFGAKRDHKETFVLLSELSVSVFHF